MIDEWILDRLRRDEGLRLKPYTDTSGKLTIGYGHNLTDRGITKDEAEYLLQNDATIAQTELLWRLPWVKTLDPVRRAVLVMMAFNMGTPTLLQFTRTLAAVKRGNYDEAAQQMLKSKWSEQVGPRANRLAAMMATGEV